MSEEKQKEYINEIVADIKNESRPVEQIKIRPPDENTVYFMEDLLDGYNEGLRNTNTLNKVDRIMSRLDGKKPGSSIVSGKFIIRKLSEKEYQLDYKNKNGINQFRTGSRNNIRDYLYQIENGLILWQNDEPTLITNVKF